MRTFLFVLSAGLFAYGVSASTLWLQKQVGKQPSCKVEEMK